MGTQPRVTTNKCLGKGPTEEAEGHFGFQLCFLAGVETEWQTFQSGSADPTQPLSGEESLLPMHLMSAS